MLRILFLVLGIGLGGVSSLIAESVYLALADRVEYSVTKSLVASLKLVQKLFHIFSFGCLVLGAYVLYYRKLLPSCEICDVALGGVQHGSDKGYFSV